MWHLTFDSAQHYRFIIFVSTAIALVYCKENDFKSMERWKSPCGTNTSNGFGKLNPIQPGSLSLQLKSVIAVADQLSEASKFMEEFILKYKIRFEHPHFVRISCSKPQPYMPDTEIPDEKTSTSKKKIANTYLESYRKLSVIGVVLEQIEYDEKNDDANNDTQGIQNHQMKLYDIMCNLKNAILNAGSNIISHVTSDVMSENDRKFSSRLDRYCRDYRILEHSRRLYAALHKVIVTIRNHIESVE